MEIRAAYIFLREKNQTIPSDTLQFMLDASLEKLNTLNSGRITPEVTFNGMLICDKVRINDSIGNKSIEINAVDFNDGQWCSCKRK